MSDFHKTNHPSVGIVTPISWNNYGTVLQAFALQKFLQNNNYTVQVIDFHHTAQTPTHTRVLKLFSNNTFSKFISIIFKYISNILIRNIAYAKHNKQQKLIFSNFRTKYLNIVSYQYSLEKDLESFPFTFDNFIVGSDNVWGSLPHEGKIASTLLPYLLTFVPKNKLRIAYAASLGEPYIHPDKLNDAKKLLSAIDYISVRGKSSAEYLCDTIGLNVVETADPTLLLTMDEWSAYFNLTGNSNQINEPYILVYSIYPKKRNAEIYCYVSTLAKKTGLKVKYILYHFESGIPKYNDVSVKKFLKSFKYASYVITDTFHGTLFSIIFRKNFWVFPPAGGSPTRITDILSSLDMSDRFVDTVEAAMMINPNIDYTRPEQKLNELREFSMNWLLQALNSSNGESK